MQKNAVSEAIKAEARQVLSGVDIEEVGCAVFDALDAIEVETCWARAGPSPYGYTEPGEAAADLFEEALEEHYQQLKAYRELRAIKLERAYGLGCILGLYRYETESKSAFKEWCEDSPSESAAFIMQQLREGSPSKAAGAELNAFVRGRCPEWARFLVKD